MNELLLIGFIDMYLIVGYRFGFKIKIEIFKLDYIMRLSMK